MKRLVSILLILLLVLSFSSCSSSQKPDDNNYPEGYDEESYEDEDYDEDFIEDEAGMFDDEEYEDYDDYGDYEDYEDSGFLPEESLPDEYINWDEAYQHIGEVTTVVGPVVSIGYGSCSDINIGSDWTGSNSPENIFLAQFWYRDKGYTEETLEPYVGRTLMVYGKIQTNAGVPMIDISLEESQLSCLKED